MIGFLMVLFVILCLLLGLSILIQQGKGDMGLGSLAAGSQMLFGGSGGQDFFERVTWTLGFIFIFGSLGLAVFRSRSSAESKLSSFRSNRVVSRSQEQPAPQSETPSSSSEEATE